MNQHCVLVGAGHCAGQTAASLRQQGYEGAITIFGDEPHLPYQRPPLSKEYLSGTTKLAKVLLRPAAFYEKQDIRVRNGERVDAIDRAGQTITVGGESVPYSALVLTTGSRPRILDLPGADLNGVHYLRSISDVDVIREDFQSGRNLVIVGGGYIGLEVASVAIEAGLNVTIVELEDRILKRVTSAPMSAFYQDMHSARGVRICCDAGIEAFEGEQRVTGVRAGGQVHDADLVIVGAGVIPNVELAQSAGLAVDNGILVDERCRTDDPHIYAAGDCCNFPNPLVGRRVRLESVPNAMEQARLVAATICEKPAPALALPWFWSDQYDLKLQMAGLASGFDATVMRGEPSAEGFVMFYLADGHVIAADAVNKPREFIALRKSLLDRPKGVPERLADLGVPITELFE